MVNKETKEAVIARLKKIEGQIRGIQRMTDSEKYCIDIINQINAARRALDQTALIIMKRHLESCVVDSIKTKGGEEVKQLYAEKLFGALPNQDKLLAYPQKHRTSYVHPALPDRDE